MLWNAAPTLHPCPLRVGLDGARPGCADRGDGVVRAWPSSTSSRAASVPARPRPPLRCTRTFMPARSKAEALPRGHPLCLKAGVGGCDVANGQMMPFHVRPTPGSEPVMRRSASHGPRLRSRPLRHSRRRYRRGRPAGPAAGATAAYADLPGAKVTPISPSPGPHAIAAIWRGWDWLVLRLEDGGTERIVRTIAQIEYKSNPTRF